jgi:TetR/AcrR family transcriptional repressor of nem operon
LYRSFQNLSEGPMSRPRTFDEAAALDAAMHRFWQHGYAATSVRDLGQAMGIGAASLYNAFGNKHALFIRCLDRYLDNFMRARIARLRTTLPPRAAIETFLADTAERSLANRHGCLLVNTALEVAPHDSAVAAVVVARLAELEGFFHGCILAGRRDGSITRARPARDLARLLLTTVMGMRVLARAWPEAAVLNGALRQAKSLLAPEGMPQ